MNDSAIEHSEMSDTAGIPATALQLGMLYHALSSRGTGVDIEQIEINLEEPLRVAKLVDSWNQVLARHEILRACFVAPT